MEQDQGDDGGGHLFDVAIVGAGIAGMATAIGLVRQGITNIIVLEKATELKPVGASIGIFSNGLRALEYLSPTVAAKARDSCISIDTMVVKDLQDKVLREKKPPTNVYYMVWYLLQQYLAEELPDDVLQLGHAVESFRVQPSSGYVMIHALLSNNQNSATTTSPAIMKTMIRARVLVGTDGIHSSICRSLFGEDAVKKFYHGKVSYRGLLPTSTIQLPPPPTGMNVTYQGDEPGKIFNYRETAKGILTVTSMARFPDEAPQEWSDDDNTPDATKAEMRRIFSDYPPAVQDVLLHMPAKAIHKDPIQDIDVLPCWSKGPVICIGDAVHAMSPAMGQGANQSLEDACALVHGLVDELGQPTTNNEESSSSSTTATMSSIALCLDQIWQSRIDRVKMIHAASRARSINNNQASKSTPIDMSSEELQRVVKAIDSWHPPVIQNNCLAS